MSKISNKQLYILWGVLYIVCAGLGFIPEPEDALRTLLTFVSIGFFVPGFILLYRGQRKIVTIISAVSLGLTLAALVLNVWSVAMTALEGQVVYVLLGLVSAPMFCSQLWVLSLFLWAFLLCAGLFGKKTVN